MNTAMGHYHYQDDFKKLYDKAVENYSSGNQNPGTYFGDEELALIASNGWRVQDFFDYAEDSIRHQDPAYEIAQSIEQVRREYFFHVQSGQASEKRTVPSDLPAKTDDIDGINWLPRIMPKAIGKIKGELDDDIMYCCGGDRHFLETHNIHPAEFLRVAWQNIDSLDGIVDFLKQRSKAL